jgi:hypothetical protein
MISSGSATGRKNRIPLLLIALYPLSRTDGAAPAEKQVRFRQNTGDAGGIAAKGGANHALRAQAAACGAWRP